MDIAKYIGLFLLKNHFCYVHGLGNMELRKIPATYDSKALQAPSYEVVVTPGGSIDDNLANFIAVNEQISISKAANALRDFSIQTRKDLASGKEIPIPNIGRFAEQAGKILFITDNNFHFTPAGIPTIRNSKQLEEQNAKLTQKPSYPPPHKADSVNWSMVILVIVLVIVVGGGAFGAYYYMNHNRIAGTPVSRPADTIVPARPPVAAVDTTHFKDSAAAAALQPVVDSFSGSAYRMIIGDYPTRERADRRMKNLTIIGNRVELMEKDTSNFMIYLTVKCQPTDTTHFKDSLQRLFGYRPVVILR
jgi:nucleoid DNA-binding protein